MNPTKPKDEKSFRGACAALRNFHEVRPFLDWLEQRRAVYVDQLIRCTVQADVPSLQGRVRELDDLLAEIRKTENPS